MIVEPKQHRQLLRWFRFLHERLMGWERAERVDVRAFVEFLRETPNPQRLRRRSDRPAPGSVNAVTGKSELPVKYAARTINHQIERVTSNCEWTAIRRRELPQI